jgi:NADPH-dependent glutamate synthase beta subunit-like oxidoreductase
MSNAEPSHCIAVIGAAVAGAEVAGTLAERGVEVVVFDQNPRPYGKIEDGLPRWHVALRRKEYDAIGSRLSQPGVHFVPNTRIGRDIDFRDLTSAWGFSGVVLACGAWRDRPLPIEGADAYVGKGLIYQNPFVIWFNHAEEAGYRGERFEILDRTLVVGGGLASIDVAKAVMLELTRAALRTRGIEADLVELEVKGIPKILERHGLRFEDLGIEGCTLFYRRAAADMPLMEMPDAADEKRREKVRTGRERMLAKAMEKYRFKFEPLCAPDGLITEAARLVGLRFRRTAIEKGRVVPQDETFEVRGSCVISSIGSIPEAIEGIPMKGELLDFSDWDLGRLADYPTVFSAGNVVTGKGNIVASRKHARGIGERVIESFLGLGVDGHAGEEAISDAAHAGASECAKKLAEHVAQQPSIAPETLATLRKRVAERQAAVGYPGDYRTWIDRVTPPDMA